MLARAIMQTADRKLPHALTCLPFRYAIVNIKQTSAREKMLEEPSLRECGKKARALAHRSKNSVMKIHACIRRQESESRYARIRIYEAQYSMDSRNTII